MEERSLFTIKERKHRGSISLSQSNTGLCNNNSPSFQLCFK